MHYKFACVIIYIICMYKVTLTKIYNLIQYMYKDSLVKVFEHIVFGIYLYIFLRTKFQALVFSLKFFTLYV